MIDAVSKDKLEKWLAEARRIAFFGGAGVSTESGIPDFRSADGIYAENYVYPPETVLSSEFFFDHTKEFYRFYFDKMVYESAKPNAAHLRLAALERSGKHVAVITQNIDGLHRAAGSSRVYELHGSVFSYRCTRCGRAFTLEKTRELYEKTGVPACGCGGIIKPDVVLYGESLDGDVLRAAVAELSRADLLIVGGTSMSVYPAAGLVSYFGGDRTVVINKTPTPFDASAGLVIQGKIGEAFTPPDDKI